MQNEEIVNSLTLPEGAKRQLTMVWLKIIASPSALYALFMLGFLDVISLNVSLASITAISVIFFTGLIFAKHSAELGCCVFEQQSDEFKKELKRFIVKNILTINKEQKSNADFEEFVQRYASDVRDDSYASTGGAVFGLLGILGTFVVIALDLPAFLGDMSAHGAGFMLGSISSAFFVAAYGVFMALWWLFFERTGMSRFKKLIARQKKATSSFFWSPAEIQQRYTQHSLNSFEKIGTVFDYISKYEFFEALDQAVERKYHNFNNLLQTESDAVRLSGEHIKQSMNALLKSSREHKDIAKTHTEIINVLNLFNNQLKEMQLRMNENYARLQSISDDKIARLERGINDLSYNISKFESGLGSFNSQLLEQQKGALEAFRIAIIDGMHAFGRVFDEEGSRDYASLKEIDELKSSAAAIGIEAEAALNSLRQQKSADEE